MQMKDLDWSVFSTGGRASKMYKKANRSRFNIDLYDISIKIEYARNRDISVNFRTRILSFFLTMVVLLFCIDADNGYCVLLRKGFPMLSGHLMAQESYESSLGKPTLISLKFSCHKFADEEKLVLLNLGQNLHYRIHRTFRLSHNYDSSFCPFDKSN